MDTKRYEIYLGALLHDIGKFYERTRLKNYNNHADYNYSHATYTRAFYDDYPEVRSVLEKFNPIQGAKNDVNVINIAAHHHNTSNDLEQIIHLADCFAAATDRINETEGINIPKGIENRPLLSIFSRIKLDYSVQLKNWRYFSVDSLNLEHEINLSEKNVNSAEKYQTNWKRFIQDFSKLKDVTSIENLSETVLKLLEKYTTKISSSAKQDEIPDITLFDHAKVTAGFAVAMYNFLIENNKTISLETKTSCTSVFNDSSKNPFLLVGGDLSGIQNFIYDIKGKYAAKNLKGRSFYLYLLVKTYLQKLLEELNLTKANIIYGSGGTFYLLAQNTENTKQKIELFTSLVNKALYNIFGISIYLSVGYSEFGKKTINDKKIGELWDNLIKNTIESKKQQKYSDSIDELFKVKNICCNEHDDITGEFLKDYPVANVDGKPVKKINKNLRDLGQMLRESKYWITSSKPIEKLNHLAFNPFDKKYFTKNVDYKQFEKLSLYHYFVPEDVNISYFTNVDINIFNETEFLSQFTTNNSYGFEFYGGNKFPIFTKQELNENPEIDKNAGDIKEFEHLSKGKRFNRLSVLRMDVDNLGTIFARGFQPHEISFSRLATLSRSLDFFFSGYLNTIWEQEKYRSQTMIIYSGGDDLFIVGRWDLVIDMANEIRNRFKEYTAENPNLSISGGVAIVTPKFPILKSAILSGENESAAKKRTLVFVDRNAENLSFKNKVYYDEAKQQKIEKNSFYLLGQSVNWDIEFEVLSELKTKIFEYLTWDIKETLPHSFIQNIININKLRLEALDNEIKRQEGKTEKAANTTDWVWKILYNLKRAKARHLRLGKFIESTAETINKFQNRNVEMADFYNEISKKILENKDYKLPDYINSNQFAENNIHYMDMLATACRWAYLEEKTKKNDTNN